MMSDTVGTTEDDHFAREPVAGLCSFAQLSECRISATDGIAGVLDDLYFDDEAWVVRFVVVKLPDDADGRCVLMPPVAIERRNWDSRLLAVALTRAEVSGSSGIDSQKPVYRQHVLAGLDHYSGLGYAKSAEALNSPMRSSGADDPHLRSANEVRGYQIHALDGNLGRVHGFLIEEKSWVIRYMIVTTSDWWHGHEVLIAPESVDDVEWQNAKVNVNLTRQTVRELPPYESR